MKRGFKKKMKFDKLRQMHAIMGMPTGKPGHEGGPMLPGKKGKHKRRGRHSANPAVAMDVHPMHHHTHREYVDARLTPRARLGDHQLNPYYM